MEFGNLILRDGFGSGSRFSVGQIICEVAKEAGECPGFKGVLLLCRTQHLKGCNRVSGFESVQVPNKILILVLGWRNRTCILPVPYVFAPTIYQLHITSLKCKTQADFPLHTSSFSIRRVKVGC